jgi:excisionase family DNA binding protein
VERFIGGPSAVIGGSAVFLLSRLLKSAPVTAYIRTARWLHGDDVAESLRAIHEAGRRWEASPDLAQRHTAVANVRSPHACDTMTTEQVSDALQLSRRQIQRLAQEGVITGRRVGRRWEIDVPSVTIYQQQYQRKKAS